MPAPNTAPLDWLIQRLTRLIQTATNALEAEYPNGVEAWQEELSRQLTRYHVAAMLAGADVDTLTPAMRTAVARDVRTQLRFLERFGVEIQSAGQFQPGWAARAAMYADSIKSPYWRGKVKMLPLPAMPGDGSTQCLTRCKCWWEISEVGEGDYDCYWRLGATELHCQTCPQRSQEWAPLRIRGGVVQI